MPEAADRMEEISAALAELAADRAAFMPEDTAADTADMALDTTERTAEKAEDTTDLTAAAPGRHDRRDRRPGRRRVEVTADQAAAMAEATAENTPARALSTAISGPAAAAAARNAGIRPGLPPKIQRTTDMIALPSQSSTPRSAFSGFSTAAAAPMIPDSAEENGLDRLDGDHLDQATQDGHQRHERDRR